MSINNVTLVGRLTKDPELTYTPSGIAKVRFTLAVNRAFSNQQGEKEADFINCTAWKKQAENLANFQKKGNLIGITGRIQTGSYDGQDGKKVYTTDVVAENIQYLESRAAQGDNAPAPNNGAYNQPQNAPQQQYQQPPQQQRQPQYQTAPPQNYTRVDEDPFANNGSKAIVSEDELPF